MEVFSKTLVISLKAKTEDAEKIVESAVNRFLGKSHAPSTQSPYEDSIMTVLKDMLKKLEPQSPRPAGDPSAQNRPPQPVMRPSLTGQGPSRPSIPRPSLMTSGAPRINSSSPAYMTGQYQSTTTSVSPATLPSLSPAAQMPMHTSLSNGNGIQSVAGLLAPEIKCESGDSILESTERSSLMPSGTPTETPQRQAEEPDNRQDNKIPCSPDGRQITGLKRPLEEPQDRPDIKRPCASNPARTCVTSTETESTAIKLAIDEVQFKRRNSGAELSFGENVPTPDYESSQSGNIPSSLKI